MDRLGFLFQADDCESSVRMSCERPKGASRKFLQYLTCENVLQIKQSARTFAFCVTAHACRLLLARKCANSCACIKLYTYPLVCLSKTQNCRYAMRAPEGCELKILKILPRENVLLTTQSGRNFCIYIVTCCSLGFCCLNQ